MAPRAGTMNQGVVVGLGPCVGPEPAVKLQGRGVPFSNMESGLRSATTIPPTTAPANIRFGTADSPSIKPSGVSTFSVVSMKL